MSCPMNKKEITTMKILDLKAAIYSKEQELADLRAVTSKHEARITAELVSLRRDYGTLNAALDLPTVKFAETIIEVRGTYTGGGDQPSCIRDFVRWLLTGEASSYSAPPRYRIGTKDYDRWSNQRCDCERGYGPGHGSIVFAISTDREFADLTAAEREAAVYYLENLATIQKAAREAKQAA